MTPRYCGSALLIVALATLGGRPDLAVAGQKPKDGPPQHLPMLPAQPVWTLMLETPPSADAAMDHERIYVPIEDEGVRAFAREDGALVWQDPASTRRPLVAGGGLLFTVPGAEVRALDAATSELRWRREIDGGVAASPVLAGDVLLVATGTGNLLGLRARDGDVVWDRALGAATPHAPALLPSTAAVITIPDGRVLVVETETGETRWERTLPGTPSAPAAARDRVLVGSTNNFFYALDADSGHEVWRWRTGGDVVGAAADGDRVYFVSLDNVLRAVNRGNGNQIWKAAIQTRPSQPPMAFGGIVVLTGVSPRLDAFVGKTGAPLGSYTAPADLQGGPLIDTAPEPFEVAVVVVMRDGRMTGLRPTGLAFPDPPLVPFRKLPGRELPPERLLPPLSSHSRP